MKSISDKIKENQTYFMFSGVVSKIMSFKG